MDIRDALVVGFFLGAVWAIAGWKNALVALLGAVGGWFLQKAIEHHRGRSRG